MVDLYGTSHIDKINEMAESNAILELFTLDDVMRGTSEEIHKFCESEEAQILVEKQVLNKASLYRLSKKDDLTRRIKLISYQLAKNAKDPLWSKLVKYQKLKKEFAQKILTKYGRKAERIAKIAQRSYLKKSKNVQATAMEKKAASAH